MLSPRIPIPIGSDVYRAGGGGVYVVGYSGNFVSQLQLLTQLTGSPNCAPRRPVMAAVNIAIAAPFAPALSRSSARSDERTANHNCECLRATIRHQLQLFRRRSP